MIDKYDAARELENVITLEQFVMAFRRDDDVLFVARPVVQQVALHTEPVLSVTVDANVGHVAAGPPE